MSSEELIEANEFCSYHHIEYTFICSLEEAGLLECKLINEQKFISHDQLLQLEKMIRMYQELDINVAGIEAIINMLSRMQEMQVEIQQLRNKLRFYGQE